MTQHIASGTPLPGDRRKRILEIRSQIQDLEQQLREEENELYRYGAGYGDKEEADAQTAIKPK